VRNPRDNYPFIQGATKSKELISERKL